jgi:glucosamine--fructose-6-phosphate aminotransferase (isomerizing)
VSEYVTFASARAGQAAALQEAISRMEPQVLQHQRAGRLEGPGPILVGIGASLAAACAPTWALRTRGIHAWRLGAGDLPLPFPASTHPIIGISQSGRSSETLAVLESVEESLRYAVVNAEPSPIVDAVPEHLSLGGIPDSYASTIGYTATVAGVGMIADAWDGGSLDPAWGLLAQRFRETESRVAARRDELAAMFDDAGSVDFVGGGPSVGSAEAGALLFREVARLPAAALSTRQYLHGSMESAGRGAHVILGDTRELTVARTLSTAGHRVILVTSEEVAETATLKALRIPDLPAAPRAVLEALVMQILVEAVATRTGVEVEEFVFHHADTKIDVAPEVLR